MIEATSATATQRAVVQRLSGEIPSVTLAEVLPSAEQCGLGVRFAIGAAKCPDGRRANGLLNGWTIPVLLVTASALPIAWAQELSPQDVFKRVAPSMVVIEVTESAHGRPERVVASGSGVVVPGRGQKTVIATNCHVIDQAHAVTVRVKHGGTKEIGWVSGRDAERDLCLVHTLLLDVDEEGVPRRSGGKTVFRKLPAVRIGSSQWLEVGDPVFAVGAPQGLEL